MDPVLVQCCLYIILSCHLREVFWWDFWKNPINPLLVLDPLILGETFLNNSVNSQYITIEGYQLYRNDCDSGSGKRSGGGLAVYVRDHYDFNLIDNWSLCTPDLEYI